MPAKKRPASDLEPEVPSLKLLYFNIKAKGEPIKLACAYAGIPLEFCPFAGFEEFQAMKASGVLQFGQVPALVVNGSTQIVQTAAILRYVARLKPASGLYPDDLIEASTVDTLMDQVGDAFIPLSVWKYSNRFGFADDMMTEELKEKLGKAVESECLPQQLGFLDKYLEKSSTGWLAGTSGPTVADFYWVCQLQMIDEWFKMPEPIKAFPRLMALVDKLMALPAVKAHYAQ